MTGYHGNKATMTTNSNLTLSNASIIETTHVPLLHLTMSVYAEITIMTSSIDVKTEPHEGRNKASVNLHAQVQQWVPMKWTRLRLENASD